MPQNMNDRRLPAWLPADLISLRQFVAWRFFDDGKSKKPRKVPVDPTTLQSASSTNPNNWSTYADAVAACRHHQDLAGIGFVFCSNDPYCGIDLDNCFDATGAPKPWAKVYLDLLTPTYAEISPSLKGVKLIARGTKPAFAGCKKAGLDEDGGGIEIYDNKRFFTLTGNIYGPAPFPAIEDRQQKIETLCRMLWPSRNEAPPAGPVPDSIKNVSEQEMQRRENRCMHYMQLLPPSIDGRDGSGACLRAACETQRFGLNHESAWRCLCWFNQTHCSPRWSWDELLHKLESAVEKVADEGKFGSRLTERPVTATASIEPAEVISIEIIEEKTQIDRIDILD